MQNDVMISYQRDSTEQIAMFEDELKKKGLKVWRDDVCFSANNKPLTEILSQCFFNSIFPIA